MSKYAPQTLQELEEIFTLATLQRFTGLSEDDLAGELEVTLPKAMEDVEKRLQGTTKSISKLVEMETRWAKKRESIKDKYNTQDNVLATEEAALRNQLAIVQGKRRELFLKKEKELGAIPDGSDKATLAHARDRKKKYLKEKDEVEKQIDYAQFYLAWGPFDVDKRCYGPKVYELITMPEIRQHLGIHDENQIRNMTMDTVLSKIRQFKQLGGGKNNWFQGISQHPSFVEKYGSGGYIILGKENGLKEDLQERLMDITGVWYQGKYPQLSPSRQDDVNRASYATLSSSIQGGDDGLIQDDDDDGLIQEEDDDDGEEDRRKAEELRQEMNRLLAASAKKKRRLSSTSAKRRQSSNSFPTAPSDFGSATSKRRRVSANTTTQQHDDYAAWLVNSVARHHSPPASKKP